MKLPEKFKCGRFKLESFFVFSDKVRACSDILINGIPLRVIDPHWDKYDSVSREITERLNTAKAIIVYSLVNQEHYSITIKDDWVYIEKCY